MRVRILALFNFDAGPDPGSALDPGHEHLFMIYCWFEQKKNFQIIFLTFFLLIIMQ